MKKLTLIFIVVSMYACSSSTSNLLFDGCIEAGMKEQMEGMDESDRASVRAGVEKGCEMIVQECNKNPEGEMCAAFQNKFIK
jgi:hypothetical protein